ncbi:hypothetical protein [Rhodococcus olei]|uniref:hypothetical protein n=1 Tax=Rhodococcus olei TaxID=2161675 RepID=UPI0031EB49DB
MRKLLAVITGTGIVLVAAWAGHPTGPEPGLSETQVDLLADVRTKVPALVGASDQRIVEHAAVVCDTLAQPRRNRYRIALSSLRGRGFDARDAETFVLYAAGISCQDALPQIPR